MTQYNVKYTAHNLVSPKIIPIQSASIYSVIPVTLFGRTRLRYGSKMNENFLHLLENFACPSAVLTVNGGYVPDNNRLDTFTNPVDGQFWYDNRMHKMRYYSAAKQRWLDIRDDGQVAALCGIISDGEQIPLPIGKNGRTFTYSECSWMVSPFNQIEGITEMRCFTDNEARVTHTYRYGDSPIRVSGIANYIIIAIGDNINLGTIRPTPTPLPVDPCVITITGNQPSYVSEQTVTWYISSRRNSTITFFIDSVEVGTAVMDNAGNGSFTFSMPEVEEDTQIEVSAASNVIGCGSFSALVEVLGGGAIPCSITESGATITDGRVSVAEGASVNLTINSGTFPGTYTISSTQTTGSFSPPGPFELGVGETQPVTYTAGPVTTSTNYTINISSGGGCSSNLPITVTNVNSCSISATTTSINRGTSTAITVNCGGFPGTYNLSMENLTTPGSSVVGTLSSSSVLLNTPNASANITYTAPNVTSGINVRITAASISGGCTQSIVMTIIVPPLDQCSLYENSIGPYLPGANVPITLNAGSSGGTYSLSDSSAGGAFFDGGVQITSISLGVNGQKQLIYRINAGAAGGSTIILSASTSGAIPCTAATTIGVQSQVFECSINSLTPSPVTTSGEVTVSFTAGGTAGTSNSYSLTLFSGGPPVQTKNIAAGQTDTFTGIVPATPGNYTASVTGCSDSIVYTVEQPATGCSLTPSFLYSPPLQPGSVYQLDVITGSTTGTYTLSLNGVSIQTYGPAENTSYQYTVPIDQTGGTLNFTLTGPNSCSDSVNGVTYSAATSCSLETSVSSVVEGGNVTVTVYAGSFPASYTLSAVTTAPGNPTIGSFSLNPVPVAANSSATSTYTPGTVSENTTVSISASSSVSGGCTPAPVNIIVTNSLILDSVAGQSGVLLTGASDSPSSCTPASLTVAAADYIISGSGSYSYSWVVTQSQVSIGAYTATVGIVGGNTGSSVYLQDIAANPGTNDCPPNSGASFLEGELLLTVTDTVTSESASVEILLAVDYTA